MSSHRKTKSGGKRRKKRLRKKASSKGKGGENQVRKGEPELDDHTLILCGLHAECRKLSGLIGVMAKGYSECEGES
jgi:hypothetical protein